MRAGLMTSRRLYGRGVALMLAVGFSLALGPPARAQIWPADMNREPPVAETGDDTAEADVAPDPDKKEADVAGLELDWSQLHIDPSTLSKPVDSKARRSAAKPDGDTSWSSKDKANGSAAVSVKQPVSTFWDARIGADMTVVNQPQTLTGSDLLRQKYSSDAPPSQSSGTAWAAVTAPGAGPIWDKTAVEARFDPTLDQSKLGTSLSKSLPFGERYSLTLQNGYNVIEQGIVPVPGIPGRPLRNYQADQSAKLDLTDSGTSFVAGQSLSSADDKWLRRIGAEQKLFGGVSISGSIGETALGPTNKSLTAGFKQSW
jgi:hypothetical protein